MKAGFGVAEITPTPPVYLAGFGARTEPATAVHDELEARAFYVSDDATTLCLIVCDLLGMTPDVSTPIREALAGELATPIANVLVACTHTHHGPSVITGSDRLGWPTPDGYPELIQRGCVAAAVAAREAARPARLGYGRAPLPDGFAFNRRDEPYEEPTFAVLDVRDDSDSRIGVIANLGIHPVLLGPNWFKVATDWVGPFRGELERVAGGAALELTAALGDINPTPPAGKPGDAYEPWASAEQTADYGRRLARTVADALERTEPIAEGLAMLRHETIEAPVGGTAISALYGESTMRVELVEWSIGDLRVVSMPGEAFHLLGREISAARGGRALLAGLAPSWHGYLPHPWGAGYEEGVSYGEEFVTVVRQALLVVTD